MRIRAIAAILPGLAGVLLSACSPSIDSVTVVPGSDVQVVSVEARIGDAALASVGTPTLSVAALPSASPNFVAAGTLSPVGGNLHRRDDLALPQGQFRAQVTVPYGVVFTPGTRTVTRTVDFTIAAPEGCFFFDIPGTGSADWTADGYFEITTQPDERRTVCAGQSPLLFSTGPNFPSPFSSPLGGAFDSLMVPLNQPCFTSPPANLPSGFVATDFVSPDLSSAPGWTAAGGYELQAISHGHAAPNVEQQVRLQLIAVTTTDQVFAEVDAGGSFVFHPLTGGWQALSMTLPDLQTARVRVRMFVPRTIGPVLSESGIAIDRVCPRPG